MATRKPGRARTAHKSAVKHEAVKPDAQLNGETVGSTTAGDNSCAPTFEQIQQRAYELFLARGGTHGCDWADWFAAERELTSSLVANSPATRS